jgi:hypothetical protein
MLKITVHEGPMAHTIKLEGKIAGPWVEEFHRAWTLLAPSLGAKELQVDLRGVAFTDDKGKRLLREIYQKTHARFLADSPLTQYFADEAMQKSRKKSQEGA